MANKCELKQYLADETEKDKKLLQVKVETLQSKVKEMMQQSDIFDKLSQLDNKAQWAAHTRKSVGDSEQA